MQGEARVPIDVATIPAFRIDVQNPLPVGGGPPPGTIQILCAGRSLCDIVLRIDRCALSSAVCRLGDLIPIELDLDAPPPPAPSEVQIDDSDTADGTLDQICVEGEPEDTAVVTVQIRNADGTTRSVSVEIGPDSGASEERLPGGRVRRCVSIGLGGPGEVTGVTVGRRDGSGNEGFRSSFPRSCEAPPRKHVGFDGRRSAMAIDRRGTPHVLYTDGAELRYSWWDAAEDQWTDRAIDCLCPGEAPSPNECPARCATRRWGLTLDIAIDSRDRPLICYQTADARLVTLPDGTVIDEPGWERVRAADTHVATIRPGLAGDIVSTRIIVDPDARPLGCAVAARRSEPFTDANPEAMLVHATARDADDLALRVRYLGLGDAEPGDAGGPDLAALNSALRLSATTGALGFDVAADGRDAFWVVSAGDPARGQGLRVFGELAPPAGTPRLGPLGEVRDAFVGGPVSRPRIAARGDGEVAIVFTRSDRSLGWAWRSGSSGSLTSRSVVPSTFAPALAGREAETEALQNVGGLASAAGLSEGIPADIAFSPGEELPRIAWAAGRPEGTDYHVVLLATPLQGDVERRFMIDTIDGRVEGTGSLELAVSAAGRSRILVHNRLGRTPPSEVDDDGEPITPEPHTIGSLQFWREEDEDELFRDILREPLRRGATRCFADRLWEDDRTDSIHEEHAALDDAWVQLVPRPAIDVDPCGRTTDPGLELELAWRTVRLVRGIADGGGGDPLVPIGEVGEPDRRPPSQFRRLPGETDAELAMRTNPYRRELMVLLRQTMGDLSFLDTLFPRSAAGESWNDVDFALLPDTDELFGDDGGRSGVLDGVLLSLGEGFDDFCGLREMSRQTCAIGDAGTIRPVAECPDSGTLERNPSGFFSGLFYRGGPASTSDPAYDFDPFRQDAASYHATFGDPATDRSDNQTRDRSLLISAIRDLQMGGDGTPPGIFRRMDHVCVPERPAECSGGVPGTRVDALDIGDLTTGRDPSSAPSPGACPSIRPGARLRYPESFAVATSLGTAPFIPMPGTTPCTTDGDCPMGETCSTTRGTCSQSITFAQAAPLFLLAGAPVARPAHEGDPFGCCTGYEPVSCDDDTQCSGVLTRADLTRVYAACVGGTCTFASAIDETTCLDAGRVPACDGGSAPIRCVTDSASHITQCGPGAPPDGRERICCATLDQPACRPESCRATEPIYCSDTVAEPLLDRSQAALCTTPECEAAIAALGETPSATLALDAIGPLLPAIEAIARGGGCGPGARCETNAIDRAPATAPRTVLGHHAVRLAALAGNAGLAGSGSADAGSRGGPNVVREVLDTLAGLIGRSGLDLAIRRRAIDDVTIGWQERRDGGLRLQGRLVLRIGVDGIESRQEVAGVPVLSVRPFELRVELEPYFHAEPSPVGACDACQRRRPDLTVHFRVARAGVFRLGDPDVLIDRDDVTGCGCDGFTCASCQICAGCARPLELGGREISNTEDVPAAINELVGEFAIELEAPLDAATWFLTSEPLVGGLLLGRLSAVEALVDAETCSDSPPRPARADVECGTVAPRPGRTFGADTVETLRVQAGRAEVVGRENPRP